MVDAGNGILLESAEVDGRWGRYSILACDAALFVSCRDGKLALDVRDERLASLGKFEGQPFVEGLRALMQAVVEIFDAEDLRLARQSGARIIQVNARDLESLAVDRDACLQLARACPPGANELWIAASGMSRPEHLAAAAQAGYRAALVGSALMENGVPGQALAALLGTTAKTGENPSCFPDMRKVPPQWRLTPCGGNLFCSPK